MPKRALALLAAGALALASSAVPASAWVPEKTPKRHLEAEIRRAVAAQAVRPSTPGLLVLRGGRPIFGVNADRPLAPASILKLATTTTAILRFGPDARFATRVFTRRPIAGVTGSITLVGGGDPTLATAAFLKETQ